MNTINYLTIVSIVDYDIIRELKHLDKLHIIKYSTKGLKVRYESKHPDTEWLESLHKRYHLWWIKNEWMSDGVSGIWISDGTNYKWDDLSLDDEHYIF